MAETLAEALQNLSDEKDNMVAALVAKGVDIDNNAGFSDITAAISNVGPVKLTATGSYISKSDMYAINIGSKTLVFGSFQTSQTSYSYNTFTYPSTFNFAHTSAHSYKIYGYDNSSSGSYTSSTWSVNTSTRTVSIGAYTTGSNLFYACYFY